MRARKPVEFRLNGVDKAVFVEDGQNLLDVLRRSVGDLSPKYGCGQGGCGCCTVLVDGEPHLSCLMLAEMAAGREIETAAGLAEGSALHPLQEAFITGFAAQCGYCMPGMLLAAKALLAHNPDPSREEVAEAIAGNICRCTGYEPIIDAILAAAAAMRGSARAGAQGARP